MRRGSGLAEVEWVGRDAERGKEGKEGKGSGGEGDSITIGGEKEGSARGSEGVAGGKEIKANLAGGTEDGIGDRKEKREEDKGRNSTDSQPGESQREG